MRERLLEIMLVRFDVLAPYKDGVCELLKVTGKIRKCFDCGKSHKTINAL